MVTQLLAEALELSVAERIELAQDLWDSVSEVPDSLELTAEQRAELTRRIEAHRKNPDTAIPWEDVKTKIGL